MIRLLAVCISLVLAACSSSSVGPPDLSSAVFDTGDLGELPMSTVVVDGRDLAVAVASSAEDRSQGLRGVTDLGDFAGMLFTWGGETVTTTFTMADTVIALDIAFFDAAGAFVDGFTMVPCEEAPCPPYRAARPYAYALESLAGSLPDVGQGSVLVVGG